jgi:hypothetical protein
VVNLSAPISPRQVEVLRWIADGCPDGVVTGYSYKTTAKALQGRRLVTAGVRAGAWQAKLTDAGRYYLEHGCYPPGLWRETQSRDGRASGLALPRFTAPQPALARPSGPPAPSDSAARVHTTDDLAADLVARVVAAGGILEADDSLAGDAGKSLVAASRHASGLPFGKQLRLRSRGIFPRVREVYLDEDFSVRVSEQPVPVPQRVTRLHPAAAAYRDDPDRHEVSRDCLSRATRILHALASEAQRRGHDVTAVRLGRCQYNSDFIRSLQDGQLAIGIDGFSYTIRIREQQGSGGVPVPYGGDRGRRLPRWRAARTTTFVPTGRLRITAEHGYSRDTRPAEFRDTKTRLLEDRLPAILRELEIRALEDGWRRREEQRRAEDKRRRWEQAMERARHDFRHAALAAELTRQLERRRLAAEIDQYLAGLRSVLQDAGEQQPAGAPEWKDWITSYRQEIDPLRHPPTMPTVNDPSPEDLRPFLNGWSPYGPDEHR